MQVQELVLRGVGFFPRAIVIRGANYIVRLRVMKSQFTPINLFHQTTYLIYLIPFATDVYLSKFVRSNRRQSAVRLSTFDF